jgi:hypothetical protein
MDEFIDFPDTVLAYVAQFLTKTERALVAVAMTASSKSWRDSRWRKRPSEATRVMIAARPMIEKKSHNRLGLSYRWDTLDFEDIDMALAKRLSDEDIGGILVCTDAINTFKVFKLKGCFNIVGHGLEPLRGSRVLEQLDLCSVGSKKSWHPSIPKSNSSRLESYFPPLLPLLSQEVVIPILDSIIDDERSVLRHLSFPKKWRLGQNAFSMLTQFLVKYHFTLNRRELTCSIKDCGSTCLHLFSSWVPRDGDWYGIQRSSCYACKDQYCEEHSEEMTPHVCESCESTYCMDCNPTRICDVCFRTTCQNCTNCDVCDICDRGLCDVCCDTFYCEACDQVRCMECSPFRFCQQEGCYEHNCGECTSGDSGNGYPREHFVEYCPTCDATFCGEHLVLEKYLRGEESFCGDCNSRVSRILKETNEYVLSKLHELEALCGCHERYDSDPRYESITDLLVEQTRMKQRWDHLCIQYHERCMSDPGNESAPDLFAEQKLHRMKQLWDRTCCLSTSKQTKKRKDIFGIDDMLTSRTKTSIS